MAGALVVIDSNTGPVDSALQRLARQTSDLSPAFREIGEHLLISHDERWSRQQAPDGSSWAPLSPLTKARKERNQDKILVQEGHLRESLRYQVGADFLEFGTNRVYAAVHQFGAKMGEFGRYYQLSRLGYDEGDFRRYAGMKQGHPIPWGDIPARPFLGLSSDDEKAAIEIVEDHLQLDSAG